MGTMERLLTLLARLCRWMAGAALVLLVMLVVLLLGARYLSVSVPWADEVARLAFVWTIALGAAAGLHNRAHFALAFFADQVSGFLQQWLARLLAAIVMVVLALLLVALWASMPVVVHSTLPATDLSRVWMQAPLAAFAVLGMVFMTGQFLCPTPRHRQ